MDIEEIKNAVKHFMAEPYIAPLLDILAEREQSLAQEPAAYYDIINSSQVIEKRPLYASPVPAQQSPAVAVPELRKCCGNPIMDNGYVCCGEYLYGDDAADQDVKLDKPAMVFATTFRAGVSERLVIEAAQRYYEYREENPPEKDNELRNKFFEAIDKVQSPRITEQDASDIIESYVESPDCFNDWIKDEGLALLNKLSAKGDSNANS